jgi:hypothetical protein
MASAAGFCLVLIFGRLLDEPIGGLVAGRRGLSHWDKPMTADQYTPDPDGGRELLGLWAIFALLVYITLVVSDRVRPPLTEKWREWRCAR